MDIQKQVFLFFSNFVLLLVAISTQQRDLNLIHIATRFGPYMDYAVEMINNRSDILPDHLIKLETRKAGRQDIGEAFKALIDAVRDDKPTKIMILGPAFTSQAKVIAEMAKYYHIAQIGYTITSPVMSNKDKYPYFARVSQSTALRNPPMIHIMKKFGWKRMATIGRTDEFIAPSMVQFQELMKDNNFTLLATASYDTNPAPQVKQLKDVDARIMIGYPWLSSSSRRIECEIFRNGLYGPKYQWLFFSCSFPNFFYNRSQGEDECTYEERRSALEGALCLDGTTNDRELNGGIVGDTGMTLEDLDADFNRWSLARYNRTFSLSPAGFDAVWTAAKALNATIGRLAEVSNNTKFLEDFTYNDEETVDIILDELKKLEFQGLSGHVAFDSIGDRYGMVVINQIRHIKLTRIATYDPLEDSINWMETMQFQDGRPPNDSLVVEKIRIDIDSSIFAVMTSLSTIGGAFCIVCVVFNVVYKDLRFIKLSSPRLNNLIAIGCLLSYLSVIMIGLNSEKVGESNLVCSLRVWGMVTGFTFAFGSMFAKTWRVHVLFTHKKLQRTVVKDGHLFAMVGVVWLIDIIILTLWAILDPLAWRQKEMQRLSGSQDGVIAYIPIINACSSTHQDYWMGALYGYKGLLILFGIFFAWETRKVRIEGLNDSKQIGICVYNVMVMSALALPMVHILTDSQINIIYAIISAAILICATTTLGFVFVSKMYLIMLHGNKVDAIAILPFASSLQADGPSVMGSVANRSSAVSGISDLSGLSAFSGRNELSVMTGSITTSTDSRSTST